MLKGEIFMNDDGIYVWVIEYTPSLKEIFRSSVGENGTNSKNANWLKRRLINSSLKRHMVKFLDVEYR